MIKLKLGRPVIATHADGSELKGTYICSEGENHQVLPNGTTYSVWFKHVKPDPDGAPMNGDEVYAADNPGAFFTNKYWYIGNDGDGHVIKDYRGVYLTCNYVRHPQPESKREKVLTHVKKAIGQAVYEQGSYSLDNITDEILKICEVEE